MISAISCVAVILATYFLYGVSKTARKRWRFHNLPTVGRHHPIFGSLGGVSEVKSRLPDDCHFAYWGILAREKYGVDKILYLDLAPLAEPFIMLLDGELSNEITLTHSTPKSKLFQKFLAPVVGEQSMVTADGQLWKFLRSTFNPGFSKAYLNKLIPHMVRETSIFREVLKQHASDGSVFSMDELATRLTIDIIAHVVLSVDFKAQTTTNKYVETFRAQAADLRRVGSLNPFANSSPFWKWRTARRSEEMRRYIGTVLDEQYEERIRDPQRQKTRSIIDLALDSYEERNFKAGNEDTKLDPAFRSLMIDQFQTFLSAGHETTSSVIAYVFYLLHHNIKSYDLLSEELDRILGPSRATSVDTLESNSRAVNELVYTNAVIQETLRLFPPAATFRQPRGSSYKIRDPETGREWPTFGCRVFPLTAAIQRDPKIFPSPHDFIPERFLPDSPFPAVPSHSYRPFSNGPRNCIGGELAMLEIKIVLALTVREFDFVPEYGEVPKAAKREKHEALGSRAYQVLAATAKPKDGMPGRIRLRQQQQS